MATMTGQKPNTPDVTRDDHIAILTAIAVARAALDNGCISSGDIIEGWAFCALTLPDAGMKSLADEVAMAGQRSAHWDRTSLRELGDVLERFTLRSVTGPTRDEAMTIGLAARNVISDNVEQSHVSATEQVEFTAACIAVTAFAAVGEAAYPDTLQEIVEEIRVQEEQMRDIAPSMEEAFGKAL